MTVFLIPNLKKENAVPTALRAAKTLRGAGARVLLSDAVREYFVGMGQEFAEDAKAFELCDVIVTVGGDGTILHAARQSLGYNLSLIHILPVKTLLSPPLKPASTPTASRRSLPHHASRTNTVSYTHLDVYKRQDWICL